MVAFLYDFELMACMSFLIPLIPAWIRFRNSPGAIRFFIIILSIVFVFSTIGHYTGLYGIRNLLLYSVLYIIEFYLFSILFKKLLPDKPSSRVITLLLVLFTVYIMFSLKRLLSAGSYDSYTPAILSLAMILYCILFFNRQLKMAQDIFIYKTVWFWIVTGLLLYFAGSFIIFLVTNYFMERDNILIRNLWVLLQVFNIGENLIISIGFLFLNRKRWSRSF